MVLALTGYVWRKPALRGYGLFRARLRVDPKVMAEILRLGLPIGALVGIEAGLFSAVSILSGTIGAETLAAHQVLMAWIGIPFVIALGMAEGTMVRVAFNTGAGSPRAARLAGLTGLFMGSAVLIMLVIVPVLGAEQITGIFVPASDPGFAAVAAIAAQLMLIAAVFQVFDGAQAIMSRALRGVKDAWFPLWIGIFGYWVLGVGGGYILAFPMGWGGAGLWTGLAIGLIVAAIMLTIRFTRLTSKRIAAFESVRPSGSG
jgi:MATE family multidrug resistance protein